MRSATSSAIPESFPNPDTLVPRSFTTTRALRSARGSTYARPSPRPAPVTTATFPSNEIRSVISLSSCGEPQNVGGPATVRFAPRTTVEASFQLPVPFSPLPSRADMNLSGCHVNVPYLTLVHKADPDYQRAGFGKGRAETCFGE